VEHIAIKSAYSSVHITWSLFNIEVFILAYYLTISKLDFTGREPCFTCLHNC